MKLFSVIGCLLIMPCFVVPVVAQQQDELLQVLQKELTREMEEFSKAQQPPYFLAYRINDIRSAYLASSFGSLVTQNNNDTRILVTDIKVGDYNMDNSHPIEERMDFDMPYGGGRNRPIELPMDNKAEAIQLLVWQQTQASYREALSMYKAIKGMPKKDNAQSDVADFSKETAVQHVDPPIIPFSNFFDESSWVKRVKKYSEPFIAVPNMVSADATVDIGTERKYFISSEGTQVVQNRTYVYINISASIRAIDGDIVPLHKSYFAFTPHELPTDDVILKEVSVMIEKLNKLRVAPVAEPYTGPAILYAHAAGVFFHEIFGHRVEGHRLKNKNDGQTFKGKLKEQVLPKTMSVVFDPTLTTFKGQALNGHYQFDDEGIKGQRVKVVENGVLKGFLMSRSPLENFPNSNGHGRAQAGTEPVSRQSNLIIENEKVVPMNELRKRLINECQKQKKPYGYLFMDVVGGFTTTERYMPNAFNIFPTEVYRIYVDGRLDELVRGVDLIGTPLAMFAEIQAADDKSEVFTGFCGAESGSVPVTAISPSLFVKRIETQKKPAAQVEQPLLDKPYQH